MNNCFTDSNNRLMFVKRCLLLVTFSSAVVYIVGFYLNRNHWKDYYQERLKTDGVNEDKIKKISKINYYSMIIFTVVLNIVYQFLIFKEYFIGILVGCILSIGFLIYFLLIIEQPLGLTAPEICISMIGILLGFTFAYMIGKKYIQQKRQKARNQYKLENKSHRNSSEMQSQEVINGFVSEI